MNSSDNRAPKNRGILSIRRAALLATTIAGLGAAAFVAAPDLNLSATYPTAHAQNLTEQAHKINAPVGFADIVAKVKPAVISVRVRIDGDKDTNGTASANREIPPGLRDFFRRFGMPDMPDGPNGPKRGGGHGGGVIMGQGSGFFISADGFNETNLFVVFGDDKIEITFLDEKKYKA